MELPIRPDVAGHAGVALVAGYMAAFERGDLDAALALCTPDYVIWEADSLPYGGEYVGRAGLVALTTKIVSLWDFAPSDWVDVGVGRDSVYLHGRLNLTAKTSGTV